MSIWKLLHVSGRASCALDDLEDALRRRAVGIALNGNGAAFSEEIHVHPLFVLIYAELLRAVEACLGRMVDGHGGARA